MTSTVTRVSELQPRSHRDWMALAATEYERTLDLVRGLDPDAWTASVTDCPGWDVRALMGHQLGAAESYARVREGLRQQRAANQAVKERGLAWIDAWAALQVEAHADLDPEAVVAAAEDAFARALRGRTKTPGLVRRIPMKFPEPIGRRMPLGYLVDTIATRDVWMHRVDICRATGAELALTGDHDGRIVADVVREWAGLHGQPFRLTLTGPAGGDFAGAAEEPTAEEIAMDAVEFCRVLSGRGQGTRLLALAVPF